MRFWLLTSRAACLTLSIIIASVAFQNCTTGSADPSSLGASGGTTGSAISSASSGNGQGYGGMTTYLSFLTSGLCPDGSNVQSEITVGSDKQTTLVRANCVTLAVPEVVSVTFTDGSSILIYNGSSYSTIATPQILNPAPSPKPTATTLPSLSQVCVVNTKTACKTTVQTTSYAAGCPQNYVCASYAGVWYNSLSGCGDQDLICTALGTAYGQPFSSCNTKNPSPNHFAYSGIRCVSVTDSMAPLSASLADGQCHQAPSSFPIPNTYSIAVLANGCAEIPQVTTTVVNGLIGCDGVCR